MPKKVSLTGIKPTGTPHIGNYFGAILPALQLAKDYDARYFIADYHALNAEKDPKRLKEQTYEVAATWLACGLNPNEMLFYRQSAVPETFELATILAAFTPKGMMNRAHAYKAIVQENKEAQRPQDDGVNMGLYTYPLLMAADILLFDADVVPVGKDQQQHLEMTVDIAEAVNRNYGQELLKIPKAVISEETKLVLGLDGRKMSKSYDNTVELFLPAKKLRKKIMKIVTNSQTVEEPKETEGCSVFALYKLFANLDEQKALSERYRAGGMGWGHAKQELFEKIDKSVGQMRARYEELINDKPYIDEVLRKGAQKAREIASQTISRLRKGTGIA